MSCANTALSILARDIIRSPGSTSSLQCPDSKMSSPYVYTPDTFLTWSLNNNLDPPDTPFIPPVSLPSSPRFLTPHITRPHGDPFATYGVRRRPRPPSWHSGITPAPSLQLFDTPFRFRRHSFQELHGTWDSPWHELYPCTSSFPLSHFRVHPLLDGGASFAGFYFNLASPTFLPLGIIGPGRQFTMISPDELRQPATNPSIWRMRIIHEVIPQWPIDVGLHTTVESPITVGDVLYTVHSSLGQKITHRDWDHLAISEQTEIACTYTRRYMSMPSTIGAGAVQGVRRVDYLGENHVFRGLVRNHDEEDAFKWKLIT